jgi:hypothetical protein
MKAQRRKRAPRAKKKRFWRCNSCNKRYDNPQAVRGHQLHCRTRRLKQQAEAEPRSRLATSSRVGKRPGPLSMEAKLLLLEVQDALEGLRKTAGQFSFMANELARMNVRGEDEKAHFWARVYQDIDDGLRDLDPMLPLFQLDRMAMFKIYNTLRNIKSSWLDERAHTTRLAETEDGLDPETRPAFHQEETRFVYILDHLRRLIAAAP